MVAPEGARLAGEERLAGLSRSEVSARVRSGAAGVLPIGSLEQHGDHLPVITDTLLVETICLRAARRAATDVLVLPALWTGFSPHHARFGATVTLESVTFLALLRDIVRSLRRWLPRLLLVNGHGGNRGPLVTLAVEERVLVVSYWELVPEALLSELFPADRGSVGHAGQIETSLMLAVAPDLVGAPAPGHEPILADNEPFFVPDLGASGVLGDPGCASAELGARLLDAAVEALARRLDALIEREEPS